MSGQVNVEAAQDDPEGAIGGPNGWALARGEGGELQCASGRSEASDEKIDEVNSVGRSPTSRRNASGWSRGPSEPPSSRLRLA